MKYLESSQGTGYKIMSNLTNFKFKLLEEESNENNLFFYWEFFYVQKGRLRVQLDGQTIKSATMITLREESQYLFKKSLSLNDDTSLELAISYMIQHKNS